MAVIYRILNTENNNFYIGSSISQKSRWKVHCSQLNRGKHSNLHLQRAWNLYGSDSFKFEIIEECDDSEVGSIEQRYLDEFVGRPDCYNILRFAYAPGRGRHPSKEHREKLSQIHSDVIFTLERRNSMSLAKLGKTVNATVRDKIRKTVVGRGSEKGKFTDDQIREMRCLFKTGRYTQRQLCNQFSCSPTYMSAILNHKKRPNL